jgi:ParB family chromosome partitioning protein
MAGRLSAGHARAIATAPDPSALAERVIAGGLSVRQAEALARDTGPRRESSGGRGERGGSDKSADTRSLEHDLADVLGLDVQLNDRGGKGELTVRYTTLEQLDDLCRRLMRSGPTP